MRSARAFRAFANNCLANRLSLPKRPSRDRYSGCAFERSRILDPSQTGHFLVRHSCDPPPLKWSDSKYGFLPEEATSAHQTWFGRSIIDIFIDGTVILRLKLKVRFGCSWNVPAHEEQRGDLEVDAV